ncbi:MAG: hypothetical protein OEM52_02515 [bacterium]|nr:hypothetical protein [bacterium]
MKGERVGAVVNRAFLLEEHKGRLPAAPTIANGIASLRSQRQSQTRLSALQMERVWKPVTTNPKFNQRRVWKPVATSTKQPTQTTNTK